MSIQKPMSLYQQQKANKPLIEDLIPSFLDGEMEMLARNFVVYLRENKMKPIWCLTNQWNSNYKGKTICKIHLRNKNVLWSNFEHRNKDYWIIQLYRKHMNEYENTIVHEKLQNVIWDNVVYCRKCKPKGVGKRGECVQGTSIVLLGKEINDVCGCNWTTWALNPDAATINAIKRIIELEKEARERNV